jgi:putative MFS transporter
VNFGLLLWLPSELVSEGNSVALSSSIIAKSTLLAAPTILVAAWLYSTWSTKGALLAMAGVTAVGLGALMLRGSGLFPLLSSPVLPIVLLILGAAGMISMLLPYTSENYPVQVRGRATGWIAGCSKIGGLIAQAMSALGLVPAIGVAAALIAIPIVFAVLLILKFGRETKGRDLRNLEPAARRI